AVPTAAFVASLPDALELSERFPAVAFATRYREVVRGSLVRAVHAPAEASGPFTLAREIAGLEAEVVRGRDSLSAFERSVADLKRSRLDRESEMPALREKQREAGARLSAFIARLEERRPERDRLAREAETLETEAGAFSSEIAGQLERRGQLEAEEGRHAAREMEARSAAERLAASLPEARSVATSASEELAHRRTEAEVAAERRRSLEAA